MNQAISKILTEQHVHTEMHMPSLIIIIIAIIILKQAVKNRNMTYSMNTLEH